ncbi:MAG TPA: hypothetical protein VE152_04765, partial [Acidimicrobiales bacterium]|nr:hypothetical protein [Acidimicrobiales bacterium]
SRLQPQARGGWRPPAGGEAHVEAIGEARPVGIGGRHDPLGAALDPAQGDGAAQRFGPEQAAEVWSLSDRSRR